MRIYTIIAFISLFVVRAAFAQVFTLSGYVQDTKTGERLIGANVFNPKLKVGTTTNVYGFFSLTLKDMAADSILLVVSYIGYERWQKKLTTGQDHELSVALMPQAILLDSITVVAENLETIEQKTAMSSIVIPIRQLKMVPPLLGEVDVMKSIQLLPGVQSGMEGSSGLYVRGGAPDQNLILLDGAPVYNASHIFGFFSVFNSDAIKNVKLTKGGFPARFGGRLSSVVEIKCGNSRLGFFDQRPAVLLRATPSFRPVSTRRLGAQSLLRRHEPVCTPAL